MLERSVPPHSADSGATRLTIGVMGAADGPMADAAIASAHELGRAIAASGCILVNGACPGLPYHAARGAKELGGLVVGISPALSRDEHVERYGSPTEGLDMIVYTGSGLMGREVTNIRSSDMVVIVGGRSGTLGEFAIAYDEGKLIGVLEGTGGIVDELPRLVKAVHKLSGAHLIYDADPRRLIERMLTYYREQHCLHPSVHHRRHAAHETPLGATHHPIVGMPKLSQ
ncbi:MAG TPA: hypothetical protein V6D47_02725 [Oscillatoriaceae cyanobacterium]